MSQRELEQEMHDAGVSRSRARASRAAEKGRLSDAPGSMAFLTRAIFPLERKIATWMQETRRRRRAAQGGHLIEDLFELNASKIALATLKCSLDFCTRRFTLQRGASAIARLLAAEIEMERFYKSHPKVYDVVSRWHNRRSDFAHTLRALRKEAIRVDARRPVGWTGKDHLTLGTLLIEFLVELRVLTLTRTKKGFLLSPSDDLLSWIDQATTDIEAARPLYLPMLEPPLDWTSMHDGGYMTELLYRRPLVKTARHSGGLFKEACKDADLSRVLESANILQSVAWRLNSDVLNTQRTLWEQGGDVGSLPNREMLEPPPKPADIDTNEESLRAWKRSAHSVARRNAEARGRRLAFAKFEKTARRFEGAPFWNPVFLDYRGRLYPISSSMSHQSVDYARGAIHFQDPRPVESSEAVSWYQIQGANAWGEDKASFNDRIQWVEDNEDMIAAICADPLDCREWEKADAPFEFLAWALDYGNFLHEGPGYQSSLPVYMDGSNNGMQLFSLLLRDASCGGATNCTPATWDDKPRDIYQDVADIVTKEIQTLAGQDPSADFWLEYLGGEALPRKACKRSVMTLPYGATAKSSMDYLTSWYVDEWMEAGNHVFPRENYKHCGWLGRMVYRAVGSLAPGAVQCMEWIRDLALAHIEANGWFGWTSPEGFPVCYTSPKSKRLRLRCQYASINRKVQYLSDLEGTVDKRRMLDQSAPNYVHSIDAAILGRATRVARSRGITSIATIHDSFGVPAHDAPEMARILREVCIEIFSTDPLEALRDECYSRIPESERLSVFPERGTLDIHGLTEASYFFS